jgi:hypothetical protein
MKQLVEAFKQLGRWQKLAIGILVLLVFLTWLSVCLVIAVPGAS